MKKTSRSPRHNKAKARLQVDSANMNLKALYAQGRYKEALDLCLEVTRAHPELWDAWFEAAVNCLRLERWQDAIRYGETALAHGGNTIALFDALAYAHGKLRQWSEARPYGLQALNMRASRFNGEPAILLPAPGPLPPPPGAQTRERNIIAFSLFGRDSKYCETAVLNVQEQPHVYPHWVCRFYVDGSVPDSVIARLRQGGGQIVPVDGLAAQWPGPMWRFLAIDDALAHRVLFRDADSLISRREAAAVEQWVSSGKRFHMMRDWGSHTELMLAGLWGMVSGSLPPLQKLMERFMSAPLESRRFADQYFLRQYVWPYARASLMQHDSLFGFMNAAPFPDGEMPGGFHVGCTEGTSFFGVKTDLPNGSKVTWALYRIEKMDDGQTREEQVCAYPAVVKDGAIKANVPATYVRWIRQGTACVRLHAWRVQMRET